MYAGDSFFTLNSFGQVGLAVLSGALALACLIAVNGILRRITFEKWLVRLLAGLTATWMLFWLFLWLSPQIYYAFYALMIDGLPAQIVIKAPPSLTQLLNLLLFEARPTMADHGRGVLGWLLMIFTV
ncbi:MAG: hypothetical protein AAFY56_21935, partial [Pseudomonadota bacterium]